jgi:hypothetical protein
LIYSKIKNLSFGYYTFYLTQNFQMDNTSLGRPRLKWINDVEDDLRKLGVKRGRTKALDRVEWASIIREAKTKLKRP